MATYANRTCTNCGVRKQQPYMYQKEIYVETAKSQSGISGATMVGVFAGDKKSGNQFRSWLFNSGQRTYKRKKKVWLCGICSGNEKPPKPVVVEAPKVVVTVPNETDTVATIAPKQGMSTAAKWFWGIMLLAFIASIVDDNDKKKTTTNSPAAVTQSSP